MFIWSRQLENQTKMAAIFFLDLGKTKFQNVRFPIVFGILMFGIWAPHCSLKRPLINLNWFIDRVRLKHRLILQRLQVKEFIWMLHYYYSSENIEIKHDINRHFTLLYLLGITRLP